MDTNPECVRTARARGLTALLPAEFRASEYNRPARFETLLLAHVLEHMTEEQAVALVREYADLVRPGGQLVVLAPQEAGFRSDPTHVRLMDFETLRRVALAAGFQPERWYSFPFPRWMGGLFTYNEFVLVGRKARVARAEGGP